MAEEIITRTAGDNVYLHKDFHGALSTGIAYLEQRHGADAVRDYLWQFATVFYADVTQAIKARGLSALREHIERIYAIEGGQISITCSDDELLLEVAACPAVTHMRQHDYAVAPLFYETGKTVYAAICAGTPFRSEWLHYAETSGRSAVRFFRRQP
jgi:hypothetical protein